MKADELEKSLKQGNMKSIYLLYGEETYLLETTLKKIKKLFGEAIIGINYITIEDTNISELISNLEIPAFGYEKKLLIVKSNDIFKKDGRKKTAKVQNESDKIAEYIQNNIEDIKNSNVIVFVADDVEKNLLFQTIEDNGIICNFEKLKPTEIVKRLKLICNAYKVKTDDNTINYLIQNCGMNMQELINEIRKLIEYTGEGGEFGVKQVDMLCTKQLEAVIFDVTDYLGNKNVKSAINTLHELIANKEPIQRILVLIYGHFKKLYITKISEQLGMNLIESLSLKPNQTFLTTKYKKQATYFNQATLRNILKELTDLDTNYKIGLMDLQVGLESILCNYCE